MKNAIVILPANQYVEGDIVSLSEENVIRAAGGACLPIDVEARKTGLGFAYAKWGRVGQHSTSQSSAFAELVVPCAVNHRVLTWMAFILPIDNLSGKADELLSGQLSFTARSPSWCNTMRAGFSSTEPAIQMRELGHQMTSGGWLARGRGALVTPGSGAYSFSLFGILKGGRVCSLAVSTTED